MSINRREFLRVLSAGGLLAVLGPIACAPTPEPVKPKTIPLASATTPPTAVPASPTPASSPTPTLSPSQDPSSPLFVISLQQNAKAAWEDRPTRTLAGVQGALELAPDANLDQYGGLRTRTGNKTGFFHPEKIGERWWLIDPEGNAFIHKGVTSIAIQDTPKSQAAFKAQFGNEQKWADETTKLLKAYNFNGTGTWTSNALLRATANPPVYTALWSFMSTYGKQRGGTYQQPGHTGYPNDCIFVFDPEFEAFCDQHAKQLAATKDDPYLLGHFSDNEMPLPATALDNYLKLPDTDPGRKAALDWLAARNVKPNDISSNDRVEFLKLVVARYAKIVSSAIKKYDPNHLYLGPRLHSTAMNSQAVLTALGPFVDIVSINHYNSWTPDAARMEDRTRWSGKPFIVTEFYVKGADAGLANTTGAGWIVKTQKDRGWFYQNYVLALLQSKTCVGWHWFKYIDNDPTAPNPEPSNIDSNKGIVSNEYKPYTALLDTMKQLNERVYGLLDLFDKPK
jgi:hypothetical protein